MFIRLNSISIFAYHGVYEKEIEYGNNFEIDLETEMPDNLGTATDDLHDALDYTKLYNVVIAVSSSRRYNLLEALAHDICKKTLEDFPMLNNVVVKIRKLNPPIGGEMKNVEVEISLKKDA
jgi:dihydroneopterin aldolase